MLIFARILALMAVLVPIFTLIYYFDANIFDIDIDGTNISANIFDIDTNIGCNPTSSNPLLI